MNKFLQSVFNSHQCFKTLKLRAKLRVLKPIYTSKWMLMHTVVDTDSASGRVSGSVSGVCFPHMPSRSASLGRYVVVTKNWRYMDVRTRCTLWCEQMTKFTSRGPSCPRAEKYKLALSQPVSRTFSRTLLTLGPWSMQEKSSSFLITTASRFFPLEAVHIGCLRCPRPCPDYSRPALWALHVTKQQTTFWVIKFGVKSLNNASADSGVHLNYSLSFPIFFARNHSVAAPHISKWCKCPVSLWFEPRFFISAY